MPTFPVGYSVPRPGTRVQVAEWQVLEKLSASGGDFATCMTFALVNVCHVATRAHPAGYSKVSAIETRAINKVLNLCSWETSRI